MAMCSGGDKLKKELEEKLKKLSGAETLNVGFLETAKYPATASEGEDGGETKELHVAQVAYWNEFGTKTAPSRPFFRNAIEDNKDKWAKTLRLSFAKDYDLQRSLKLTGTQVKDDIVKSIVDFESPALSPITVMLRGMRYNDSELVVTGATVGEAATRVAEGKTNYGAPDKPLIDSSVMQGSVDFEIKKG